MTAPKPTLCPCGGPHTVCWVGNCPLVCECSLDVEWRKGKS